MESKEEDYYHFAIKTIGKRNFRVNTEINPLFFNGGYKGNAPMAANDKFKDFENEDDVDSYSGDSNFLYESDDNNENEENNDLTQ